MKKTKKNNFWIYFWKIIIISEKMKKLWKSIAFLRKKKIKTGVGKKN